MLETKMSFCWCWTIVSFSDHITHRTTKGFVCKCFYECNVCVQYLFVALISRNGERWPRRRLRVCNVRPLQQLVSSVCHLIQMCRGWALVTLTWPLCCRPWRPACPRCRFRWNVRRGWSLRTQPERMERQQFSDSIWHFAPLNIQYY